MIAIKLKNSKTKQVQSLLFVILMAFICFGNTAKGETIEFVTEHLPPYQIATENGVNGFATEIVKLAVKNAELPAKFSIYSWSRAYNMAQKVTNTCIYSIARTQERENLLHWIDVIATTNSSFISLASNLDVKINSIEDAKKYRIAVLRNDATHEALLNQGFVENVNLFVVNNTHSLLKLLTQRQSIDLVIADLLTVNHRAIHDGLPPSLFKQQFRLNEKPLDFYLACNKNMSATTLSKLSDSLKTIKTSGQYQAIINKWLPSEIKSKE